MQEWLADTCFVIICCPCILLFYTALGVSKLRASRRRKATTRPPEPKPSAPKPLPRNRRALSTISFDRSLNSTCVLLDRLPPEIRLEIYTYVVGGNLLHLVQGQERISHVRCRASSATDFLRTCRPAAANTARRIIPGSTSNGNLALMRTCRQVYIEAMDVLYSTNIFDLDDPRTLLYLSQSIRPQRLASITKLHVYCPIGSPPRHGRGKRYPIKERPYDERTWEQFWHVIATRMPRLLDLKVRFGLRFGIPELRMDDVWVMPLLEIRRLKRFDFEVQYIDDHRADTSSLNAQQLRQELREKIKSSEYNPAVIREREWASTTDDNAADFNGAGIILYSATRSEVPARQQLFIPVALSYLVSTTDVLHVSPTARLC
ncbi:MAG: hypothetical protein M1830_004431 [Pleopsidium flavum]|nr:MAG: hypothetical protein M1830_004431 [Pleopsidium flavum]